jgi:hypothetical protein
MSDKRPRAILVSSRESISVARDLQSALAEELDAVVWDQDQVPMGTFVVDALIESGDKNDCAVVIVTADDIREMRGESSRVPRDNVVFEAGLFAGILGRDRVFLVYPTELQPALPSDLDGLTAATYTQNAQGAAATIFPAARLIRDRMKKLKFSSRARLLRLDRHPNQDEIVEIGENSQGGGLRKFGPFDHEIDRTISAWKLESADWSTTKIVSRNNYWMLLADVYRRANISIFSTCVRSFVPGLEEHSNSVLKAQAANRHAKSTRLFIFDTLKSVTDSEKELVKENVRQGIEVLVLFGDEVDGAIAPTVTNDWVIVDGGLAIGVTRQIGDVYEAEWFYDHSRKRDEMLRLQEQFRKEAYAVVQERNIGGWVLMLRDIEGRRPAIDLGW